MNTAFSLFVYKSTAVVDCLWLSELCLMCYRYVVDESPDFVVAVEKAQFLLI